MACKLFQTLVTLTLLCCSTALPSRDLLYRRQDTAADVSAQLLTAFSSGTSASETDAGPAGENFERMGVIVSAVNDPLLTATKVDTEKRDTSSRGSGQKAPGQITINKMDYEGGTLLSARGNRMYPEYLDPAVVIPFLEKCDAYAYPKWQKNDSATEVHETALQFKFEDGGLAIVATGFDTAATGNYQLNWGQLADICLHLKAKQIAAPRSYLYLGYLTNEAGKKDVTFLMLNSYTATEAGPTRRKKEFAVEEQQIDPIDNPEICPAKKRFAKRDTADWADCIRLPHTNWYVRWKFAGAQVAVQYLALSAQQALNQLIADDRGIPYTDYVSFRAGIAPDTDPIRRSPKYSEYVFDILATTGQRVVRDIVLIMVHKMATMAETNSWSIQTSDKVVAAIVGEVVDQSGFVIANWAWGQPIPQTGVTVVQPDGSQVVGVIQRHDEL